jgi:hypothetical protein
LDAEVKSIDEEVGRFREEIVADKRLYQIVENPDNPQYLEILHNGSKTIEKRFDRVEGRMVV